MAIQAKPIPALYTVYILRSTVRHASLYIGSTPNPPRRLKQHNGEAPGGANRTSRNSLRPWEMVGLVSGFPSMVAALKFEWALANAHLTVHIPASSRLTVSTQRKRNGQSRRPPHSIGSILSNLHLLLRVPSFARWPLKVHFFVPDVYSAWQKWCTAANERLRPSLPVVTDFERDAAARVAETEEGVDDAVTATVSREGDGGEEAVVAVVEEGKEPTSAAPWGIHALSTDYEPIKEYVAKSHEIFEFERVGDCVVCHEALDAEGELHAVCTSPGCEGVGHVSCWSKQLLSSDSSGGSAQEGGGSILPIQGSCPECGGVVQWGDMMKELTLRLRGGKEVDKLLKVKRKRAVKAKATTKIKGKAKTS